MRDATAAMIATLLSGGGNVELDLAVTGWDLIHKLCQLLWELFVTVLSGALDVSVAMAREIFWFAILVFVYWSEAQSAYMTSCQRYYYYYYYWHLYSPRISEHAAHRDFTMKSNCYFWELPHQLSCLWKLPWLSFSAPWGVYSKLHVAMTQVA